MSDELGYGPGFADPLDPYDEIIQGLQQGSARMIAWFAQGDDGVQSLVIQESAGGEHGDHRLEDAGS